MPRINPDNWSDERKLSALVVIATAKRIARVKWILSRQEYELIRNGRQAFEDGEEVTAKSDLSSVELRQRLQHAIKQVVLGLKDFPGAGQTTTDFEARRLPLDELPYTLFYRYNRTHGDIDILAIKKEPQIHDLRTINWLEEHYPGDVKDDPSLPR